MNSLQFNIYSRTTPQFAVPLGIALSFRFPEPILHTAQVAATASTPLARRTGPGGVAGSNDIVWRNATSGRVVVWNMDLAGNRTNGAFTTPDAPSPNPTEWTVVGPR